MEKAPDGLELVMHHFADFSEVQLDQLAALDGLYRDWNEKINIISRQDIDSLYKKHVLHSLAIAAAFEFTPGMQVIDIGTGGGFPGVPLAIYFPKTRFHLVDSIGKKIKAVQAIKEAVGLDNVTTRHVRAEEIKDIKFDVVVSRAVAPLQELWSWSKLLLRKSPSSVRPDPDPSAAKLHEELIPNGLICLKGGDMTREIAQSGCRPRMMEVHDIFAEEYFKEKYLLYVPR
jgi:16S rRNA (guanine527-N7)-methyltransferase